MVKIHLYKITSFCIFLFARYTIDERLLVDVFFQESLEGNLIFRIVSCT